MRRLKEAETWCRSIGDPAIAIGGDPVELDDAPLAVEGLVPVPGILGPPEGEHRAADRRDLHDRIVEIVGRLQKPEPSARMLPSEFM